MNIKKYLAEFIGTFTLTLAVLCALSSDGSIPTAIVAGITLGLFVHSIGKISGSHINPAVTIGAWSIKKIKGNEALGYIIAQMAGAALAVILTRYTILTSIPDASFSLEAFIGEIIGTIIFTFGIASVLFAKEVDADTQSTEINIKAPFVIGGSLTLGAIIAGALGSNGVLNPAVAFGIGSLGYAYILGPIVGSIIGMWLYKIIK